MESQNKKTGGGRFVRTYLYVTLAAYGVGIAACFIVNLAVSKTLTWFFAVLSGSALLFTVTDLPFMLKRFRVVIPAALFSGLSFAVLVACRAIAPGGWLTSFAFPLAGISLAFGLALLTVWRLIPLNWRLKAALSALVVSVGVVVIAFAADRLMGKADAFTDYIRPDYWNADMIANKIIFICGIVFAAVMFVLYLMRGQKKAESRN